MTLVLRRKRLPAALVGPFDAFRSVVGSVERSTSTLTDSVPTTRLPGRPLPETLLGFEEGLRQARGGMDAWRIPEVESEWRASREAVDRCLAMAERLRLKAQMPVGFEALVGTIGDLLAPLEAFEHAAERFRSLRT